MSIENVQERNGRRILSYYAYRPEVEVASATALVDHSAVAINTSKSYPSAT
jgi:hypothetical protein